jgi:hypothetical protein
LNLPSFHLVAFGSAGIALVSVVTVEAAVELATDAVAADVVLAEVAGWATGAGAVAVLAAGLTAAGADATPAGGVAGDVVGSGAAVGPDDAALESTTVFNSVSVAGLDSAIGAAVGGTAVDAAETFAGVGGTAGLGDVSTEGGATGAGVKAATLSTFPGSIASLVGAGRVFRPPASPSNFCAVACVRR